MKILAYFFVAALIFCVLSTIFYFIRFAFVHIKAFVIRRKLSKIAETETKDD